MNHEKRKESLFYPNQSHKSLYPLIVLFNTVKLKLIGTNPPPVWLSRDQMKVSTELYMQVAGDGNQFGRSPWGGETGLAYEGGDDS